MFYAFFPVRLSTLDIYHLFVFAHAWRLNIKIIFFYLFTQHRTNLNQSYCLTSFFESCTSPRPFDSRSPNVGMYSDFFGPLLVSRFTAIQALHPSEHVRTTECSLVWSNIGTPVVVVAVQVAVAVVTAAAVVAVVHGWPLHIRLFLEQKLKQNKRVNVTPTLNTPVRTLTTCGSRPRRRRRRRWTNGRCLGFCTGFYTCFSARKRRTSSLCRLVRAGSVLGHNLDAFAWHNRTRHSTRLNAGCFTSSECIS